MTFQKDPEQNETKHLHHFADFTGRRVLEVGAGEGRLTWRFAAHPTFTIAIDNEIVFAGGARLLGKVLWRGGDVGVIDGVIVNGSAKLLGWISSITRLFQTGYVYHYAFTMIIGLFVLMTLWINRA